MTPPEDLLCHKADGSSCTMCSESYLVCVATPWLRLQPCNCDMQKGGEGALLMTMNMPLDPRRYSQSNLLLIMQSWVYISFGSKEKAHAAGYVESIPEKILDAREVRGALDSTCFLLQQQCRASHPAL